MAKQKLIRRIILERSANGLVSALGGLGTVFGPVIGSFILTPLSEISRAYFAQGGLEGLHLILYGILVILVVLFMPKGIIVYVERIMHPLFKDHKD